MRNIISVLLILNLTSVIVSGGTNIAASASRQHVGDAYAISADGDVIIVPAGTASWTNTLVVTKAVTIQGAGIGQTILLDDIIKTPNIASTEAFFYIDTATNKFYRLSGIEFRIGTRTAGNYIGGSVQITGESRQIRVDNCKFDRLLNAGVYIQGGTLGVIDNCIWYLTTRHTIATKNHELYGIGNGRGSWETPLTPGSSEMWYYEDNVFTGDDSDSFGGGRACWRFNTFTNSLIHTHGTESTGLPRGCRWHEIYGNTMYHTNTDSREFVDFRDGGGLIASNTVINTGSAFNLIQYNNYRARGPYRYWGGADGTNPLDSNDVAGGIYETGICTTATSGSGVTLRTLIDSNKNWTPNQWRGYTLRNMSSNYPASALIPYTSNYFSQIISNSATTITYSEHATALKMRFAVSNLYEIRRFFIALDQPGSGTSDPWDPKDTNNARWLNQPREPIYQWENRINGVLVTNISAGDGNIIEGRDYSNNVAHPTWSPYTYPHPLRSGDTNPPPASVPSAPTGLIATAINASQINLSWTNTATNADNIRIERSINTNDNYAQIDFLATNITSYADTPLAASTTYYYRLRAANEVGFSGYSNETNATTLSDTIVPNPSRRLNFFFQRKQIF